LSGFSDKELITGCLNGERQAIDALVGAYYARVFSLCIKIMDDRDEAKDICQDTFVRVFDKAGQFRFNSSLKTWILSIAFNLCINRLKKAKKKAYVTWDMQADIGADITIEEESLLKEQKIEVIEQALLMMDTEGKLFIEMYYLNECSIREIALILNKTENAAKTGLCRARQKLKTLVLNHQKNEFN
jgi:RNA polymerase sigma factor (sigma-70 family)